MSGTLIHLSGFCATCDKHWKGSFEVLVAMCRKTVAVAGQAGQCSARCPIAADTAQADVARFLDELQAHRLVTAL